MAITINSWNALQFIQFVVAFSVLCSTATALNKKQLVFREFNATSDPQFVLAEAKFNDQKELNLNISITQEIPNAQNFIQSKVFIKNPAGDSFASILPGRRVNLCKVIENKKVDPFLYKFIQIFSKHTTLISSCPLRVGIYTINNVKFDMSALPNILPMSTYKANIWFFFKHPNNTFTRTLALDILIDLVELKL